MDCATSRSSQRRFERNGIARHSTASTMSDGTAERVRRCHRRDEVLTPTQCHYLKHGRAAPTGLIILTSPTLFPRSSGVSRRSGGVNRDMLMATPISILRAPAIHPPHAHSQGRWRSPCSLRDRDGTHRSALFITAFPSSRWTAAYPPGLSDVLIDYGSALDDAVKHLKRLKHRSIAYNRRVRRSNNLRSPPATPRRCDEEPRGQGRARVHPPRKYRISGGETR